jgi:hypothetical protein
MAGNSAALPADLGVLELARCVLAQSEQVFLGE